MYGKEININASSVEVDKITKVVYAKGNVNEISSDGTINCEIWLEKEDGEKTTVGKAVITLPSKN